MKLGVNIDHIATLRQVRHARYPDPVHAAVLAESAGADQITVHLREDRRHIQERDVRLLVQTSQTRVNLELAATDDIITLALDIKPYRVTFVPERREELTTEGGLNVLRDEHRLAEVCGRCRRAGIEVSLFIDANSKQVESSRRAGADAVEFHTGAYAIAYDKGDPEWKQQLHALRESAHFATAQKMRVYAGHGLNRGNVAPLTTIPELEELNIGHAIVARAVFVGLAEAIREIRNAMFRDEPVT